MQGIFVLGRMEGPKLCVLYVTLKKCKEFYE